MKKSMNNHVVVLLYSPAFFLSNTCMYLNTLEKLVRRKQKRKIT